MLTSSTVSIPLILIGESSQRAVIFTMALLRGQALSPVFMYSDIIAGLVYQHDCRASSSTKHDEKNTLQKVKTLKKYVRHYDPLKCGWVPLYLLEVMLQHLNRCQWGINYVGWEEKKLCQWRAQTCSYLGKCRATTQYFLPQCGLPGNGQNAKIQYI